MPQIYIKLGPEAKKLARGELSRLIKKLDLTITEMIIQEWGVPFADVACSAEQLLYARAESDIQVEIRYTAGETEYGKEEVFRPNKEQRTKIGERMKILAIEVARMYDLSMSYWTKAYEGSTFHYC